MIYAFLMVLLPLLSSVLLFLLSDKLSSRVASAICALGLGFGFLAGLFAGVDFYQQADFQVGSYLHQTFWSWLHSPQVTAGQAYFIGIRLDALSFSLTLAVLALSFLLSIYLGWLVTPVNESTHQNKQPTSALEQTVTEKLASKQIGQYGLLFGMASLLVSAVILIVLADNLLLLLMSWIGITVCVFGLCYVVPHGNGMTKTAWAVASPLWLLVSDILMLLAVIFLYYRLGTLEISAIVTQLPELYHLLNDESSTLTLSVRVMVALFLVSLLGKMALLPYQSWLTGSVEKYQASDSEKHAACSIEKTRQASAVMWVVCFAIVMPAVYLMVRFYPVFTVAVDLRLFFGVVAVVSAVLFSLTAWIKRELLSVMLYVSLSQVGLLAVTLSTASWKVAVTHAIVLMVTLSLFWVVFSSIFKQAVYFDHDVDIEKITLKATRMKTLYVAGWFAIFGICGLPWLSGRFFSQHHALWELWIAKQYVLYALVLLAYFVIAVVVARLMYLLFHRPEKIESASNAQDVSGAEYNVFSGIALYAPTLLLMLLATPLSYFIFPDLAQILPLSNGQLVLLQQPEKQRLLYYAVSYASFLVVVLGFLSVFYYYRIYMKQRMLRGSEVADMAPGKPVRFVLLREWLGNNYGLDAAYHLVLYQPYRWFTKMLQSDPLAKLSNVFQLFCRHGSRLMSGLSQKQSMQRMMHTLQDHAVNPLISVTLLAVFVLVLRVL